MQAEIRGRDLVSGLPKTVVLTSEEVRAALEEPLVQIIDAIKETLDRTPPELASDIMDRGIMLAGGGSAPAGPRRAPARGDADARPPRRVPAHLRRGRKSDAASRSSRRSTSPTAPTTATGGLGASLSLTDLPLPEPSSIVCTTERLDAAVQCWSFSSRPR